MDYLDGKIQYNDSLELHFGNLWIATMLNENSATYESIRSIGIDIISSEYLRQQITNLYSVVYNYLKTVESSYEQLLFTNVYPVISEHIKTIGYYGKAIPLNISQITESNSLKESIKINRNYIFFIMLEYQDAQVLIKELIRAIENELAQYK